MDESTLNKPVNLQNLSLALAKTRSAISGEIVEKIDESINNMPFPDWYAQENTDVEGNITGYDPGYIANKPAVVSDTGNNSVNLNTHKINVGCCTGDYSVHAGVGSLYQNGALKLTGDANATTYTYTLISAYSQVVDGLFNHFGNNIQVYLGSYSNENPRIQIVSVDQENSTITVETTLSSEEALNSATAGLRWTARAEGAGSISINGGQALGDCSLAMYSSFANGSRSIAFGLRNIADGSQSLATGYNTTASALASHSEGYDTVASGSYSHSEGNGTVASGNSSHAEGSGTQAIGASSHAQGLRTIAAKDGQFTLGTYNIEDTGENIHPYGAGGYGQYAVILGNGIDADHRSNAHTIDWTGKGWFANTVSAGTIETPATVVNANDLTTKAYVDSVSGGGSLTLNGNVITLTNSNGTTSTITLPVYNGGVTT